MTRNKPIIEWDPEQGLATCVLTYNGEFFVGTAQCHPDDKDMMSEKTGCDIAYRRAYIKALQHYKNNVLTPGLKALQQLHNSINFSKKYNKKGYEAKAIWRHIQIKKNDIAVIKEMIANEQQNLRTIIEEKDKFYQQVRRNRNKGNIE